jgi:hypothetical protein
VQIRRLKQPLMAKIWLGPRRYLRFGHVEGLIRIRELGDMAPEITAVQSVRNKTDYLLRLFWGSYLRF